MTAPMESPVTKYQEFALELLEEDRVEDAKTLFSVVGEIAIKSLPESKFERWWYWKNYFKGRDGTNQEDNTLSE